MSPFGRIVLGCSLLAGCGHEVRVSWVAPAEVGLDARVEQVLVIDRTEPGSTGETLLELGEALATGEGFDSDRETADAAIEALRDVLEETDRYELLDLRIGGERVDPSIWDGELDPKKVAKLCARAGCDAIVALDALDTDTSGRISVDEEGVYEGTASTQLVATFRTYSAEGEVLDEQRLRLDGGAVAEGTELEAREALGSAAGVQEDLAADAGASYGRRIAPHLVEAERDLYRSGDPRLRDAIDHVKAGDWAGAARLWREVVDEGGDRDRAKARHNLAVHAEISGRLDRAIELARHADLGLDRSRTHRYLLDLEGRLAETERLSEQLPDVSGAKTTSVIRS